MVRDVKFINLEKQIESRLSKSELPLDIGVFRAL